jgi:hypothetical protein
LGLVIYSPGTSKSPHNPVKNFFQEKWQGVAVIGSGWQNTPLPHPEAPKTRVTVHPMSPNPVLTTEQKQKQKQKGKVDYDSNAAVSPIHRSAPFGANRKSQIIHHK